MNVHIDFETCSELPLKKVGAEEYLRHESTDWFCVAIHDPSADKVRVFRGGDFRWVPMVWEADQIHAHNASFERCALNTMIRRQYHKPLPEIPFDRFYCSAARAAELSLPRGLFELGRALNSIERKDAFGHGLLRIMKKPGVYTRRQYQSLYRYCRQDVHTEMEVSKLMGPQTDRARRLWLLDQKINEKGIRVDRDLCRAAINLIEPEFELACHKLGVLTEGVITRPTQVQRMKKWAEQEFGFKVETLRADVLDDILDGDECPEELKRILEVRQEFSQSSTSKYKSLLLHSEDDGRFRGGLLYHGAHTGRWTGRGPQPQNFPQGDENVDSDILADDILNNGPLVRVMYGPITKAGKNALRAALIATEGQKLVLRDLSQIEARKLPWLAGESWKLQVFRDYDAGIGPDPYVASFSRTFDVEDVSKGQRTIGKVMELALGYQGGVGAFTSFASLYRLDLSPYIPFIMEKFHEFKEGAEDSYSFALKRKADFGLYPTLWLACEMVKRAWRRSHPRIVSYWYDLNDAAIEAMQEGFSRVRNVAFYTEDDYLKLVLPSGRVLSYPEARLKDGKFGKPVVVYSQFSDKNKVARSLYGGLLAENITQASSADVMTEAMLELDLESVPMVLTVHDEIVADSDQPERDAELMDAAMTRVPKWAPGLPIAVTGEISRRYKK